MAAPKVFQLLFGSKKHKPVSDGERHPINLPEVPENKFNAVGIAEMLRGGSAIWAWYDLVRKYNVNALMNFVGNATDTFAVYRVEGEYLVKYIVVVGKDEFVLKLSEVQRMSNSNVMELYNSDLKDAYHVYYDDEGITETLQSFVHDVTDEMIEAELQTKRVMVVTDDHFKKREDAVAE